MNVPRLQTLAEVEAALWHELAAAPRDKQHAWRTPVLSTVDGDAADARTVVVREVDTAHRTLTIFSDARAAKVAQLRARPAGMLVFWSATLSWQLRLRVELQAQTDGLAVLSRWARLKLSPAAQDYLSPLAPGTVIDDSRPAGAPCPGHAERGYFAVIGAAVQWVDWLELHAEGHRRARFDGDGARWLVP